MKKLILLFSLFGLSACSTHDENFYLAHPDKMQAALNQCPDKTPGGLSCAELRDVAARFNQFTDELRANPQSFGKKILSLQENLAEEKIKGDDEASILKMEKEISQRLIIVKLFESPKG